MIPTLDPKAGKANREPEGNRMALMQAAVSDQALEQLLTADEVAERLRVSRDWVWDHSSRRLPYLPVIRMSDGALRYRSSEIEAFLIERSEAAQLRRKRR
jgi:predicted DNA-binding transcriptional regulator AlpA